MASGLFGSGPQSNILQTVQTSYDGMLNAEKQKGVAMREAMGAFGQAIDPKTIGMKKFKKQFAEADWTKPETYFEASQFISAFDPNGAMSMAQNGMQLQASQVPATDKQIVTTYDAEGKATQRVVDLASKSGGDVIGGAKPLESSQSSTISGSQLNIDIGTDKFDPNAMYTRNKTGGLSKIGGTGSDSTDAGTGTTDMQNAAALFPESMVGWEQKRRDYITKQTAIKPDASSTPAPTKEVKNAQFLFPETMEGWEEKRRDYVTKQTAIKSSAAVDAANAFLSTSDPDKYTGESMNAFVASISAENPNYDLLERYEEMSTKAEAVLLDAQDASFQSLNKAGTADALAEKLNPDALVQTPEGEEVKASLSSGWQARAGSAIKDFFGSQDEVSEIRTEFTRIKNLEVIGSLPPGVASDKDIEIVSAGFPDANANPEVLYNWLKSYANIQRADAEFNRFKAAYISKNNNSKGFMGDWKKYSKVPVSELAKYRSVINNPNIDNAQINKIFAKKYGFNAEGVL